MEDHLDLAGRSRREHVESVSHVNDDFGSGVASMLFRLRNVEVSASPHVKVNEENELTVS